ncbi:MAG: UDP-N-acetylmuramate dehydrogenase [Lachnospiraceae bacterium]|nr:UDP-N-acetylmuramate dehydrogenase [Lachnospiraceae bacterium]
MSDEVLQAIKSILPEERILENEDMDTHTTFRVGGPARFMLIIETGEELSQIVKYLNTIRREFFLLGNGSNLLVSDKGYDGIVLRLSGEFANMSVSGEKITSGAAAQLSAVARMAADNSLTGMEFAAGIPGSVGGAMVMNAGAFGGDMSMIVESVQIMDENGEILTLENETMEFSYRSSVVKGAKYIVTNVTFKLAQGDHDEIIAQMNDIAEKRRQKQPLEYPSAGSTFKRPEGYYAGKLIMDAGLRGFSIGGARVSDKHCGFVINQGYASAADIYDVICQVQETVKDKFGVKLEREVILLGDF